MNRNMRNQGSFRAVFGTLSSLFWLGRIYFMRRGSQSGERISRTREEGLRILLFLWLGTLGTVAGVVYVVAPDRIKWASLTMPTWLRWAGAGLASGALPLFLWTHQALGKNWSIALATKERQTLVSSGPYRWVRHPMYTAISAFWLGGFLLSANWVVGVAALGTGLLCAARVGDEEALMVEEFGDQYRAYMEGTGRFLPPAKVLTRAG